MNCDVIIFGYTAYLRRHLWLKNINGSLQFYLFSLLSLQVEKKFNIIKQKEQYLTSKKLVDIGISNARNKINNYSNNYHANDINNKNLKNLNYQFLPSSVSYDYVGMCIS